MSNERIGEKSILNLIKANAGHRPIYIWGAYSSGRSLQCYLNENNISIAGFLDSSPSKQRDCFYTYPVKSPDILKEVKAFVLVALMEYPSVRTFLAECGYCEYQNYLYCGSEIALTGAYNYEDAFGNEIFGELKNAAVQMDFLNTVKIGKNVKFGKNTKIIMSSCSELVIKDNVCFRDNTVIVIKASSSLIIEAAVSFGKDTYILCCENSDIIIGEKSDFDEAFQLRINHNSKFHCGKDCLFSYQISVRGTDGHTLIKNGLPFDEKKDVILADHVWVGQRAILHGGTRIGTGSVIGAASFVNKSFGSHATIAGSPAKVLTEHIDWEK